MDKDPIDKFRFRVSWPAEGDGVNTPASSRAGFQACQMPKRNTSKITYREGIDTDIQFNSAGISTMEDIVLARGLSLGINDFYKWAKNVHDGSDRKGKPGETYSPAATNNTTASRERYRRDVTIQMISRTGEVLKEWKLYNAFPIQFTAGSDLDAAADDSKSIASLTLSYDDFEEVK
jgi:phage tail-like protein